MSLLLFRHFCTFLNRPLLHKEKGSLRKLNALMQGSKMHSPEHIYYTIFSVIYQQNMRFFDKKKDIAFRETVSFLLFLKVGFKYYFGLHLLYHICSLLSRTYSLDILLFSFNTFFFSSLVLYALVQSFCYFKQCFLCFLYICYKGLVIIWYALFPT